jgi:hypothetical protein
MRNEYRIAKDWARFIYVTAPIMIALFSWVLYLPFKDGDFSPNYSWLLIPVALGMISLMVLGVLDAYKSRFIIEEDYIKSVGIFSTKKLNFDEIKGFFIDNQYIFVESSNNFKKTIKISSYTGGYGEILHWLSQYFTNLDAQNYQEELQDILSDEAIGDSVNIREEKLLRARKLAKTVNWAAFISTAWLLFYPHPYQYAIIFSIAVPIVALLVVKLSGNLIRIDEKRGAANPFVIYAFIFPSLGLLLRAILDYEIASYENVWQPTIVITTSIIIALLLKQSEITFKKGIDLVTVGSLYFFLIGYSYGLVIHYNCYYDKSNAQKYTVEILNKRTSSGKSTTRYLEVSSWGEQQDVSEVSVGKGLYSRTNVGDSVNVYYRNGNMGIPWYRLSDK